MKPIILIMAGVISLACFVHYLFANDDKKVDSLENLSVATFAGGCFWCTESDFEKVDGVKEAISGYTGGHDTAPDYRKVTGGHTGHTEAVQVYYDPAVVTYDHLLEIFWRHIDPTDPGGQFVDRGSQYRPEIFYHTPQQQQKALASRKALAASGRFDNPLAVPVTAFTTFYPAEAYHQDYYKKNPARYKYYRWGSGRDQFLKRVWDGREPPGKKAVKKSIKKAGEKAAWATPGEAEIKQRLSPLQYKVTRMDGTEPPFDNAFWDNKREGIYVDIVSGEPLFSSRDKFKSGTGWPSFTRPLEPGHIVEKVDKSLWMTRIEVRSRYADSHLGHLFDDGPAPTGLRYCINSAALRFIPKERLAVEGYGSYAPMF